MPSPSWRRRRSRRRSRWDAPVGRRTARRRAPPTLWLTSSPTRSPSVAPASKKLRRWRRRWVGPDLVWEGKWKAATREAPHLLSRWHMCVSWMTYEYIPGLLLTLSTVAGACHSNTIIYSVLSAINTEAFQSNTHHPFSPPVCHDPSSIPLVWFFSLSLSAIALFRDKQSTRRTSWRPSRPGTNTCWLLRRPTAVSSNITYTTSPTLLTWVETRVYFLIWNQWGSAGPSPHIGLSAANEGVRLHPAPVFSLRALPIRVIF